MSASNPEELIKFLLGISILKKINVECLGLMGYTCIPKEGEKGLELSVDGGDLVVTGKSTMRFPIKLINKISVTEQENNVYCDKTEVYIISVTGMYFQQFLKDEIVSELLSYSWGKQCDILIRMEKEKNVENVIEIYKGRQ